MKNPWVEVAKPGSTRTSRSPRLCSDGTDSTDRFERYPPEQDESVVRYRSVDRDILLTVNGEASHHTARHWVGNLGFPHRRVVGVPRPRLLTPGESELSRFHDSQFEPRPPARPRPRRGRPGGPRFASVSRSVGLASIGIWDSRSTRKRNELKTSDSKLEDSRSPPRKKISPLLGGWYYIPPNGQVEQTSVYVPLRHPSKISQTP